jgi:hypothetical protein
MFACATVRPLIDHRPQCLETQYGSRFDPGADGSRVFQRRFVRLVGGGALDSPETEHQKLRNQNEGAAVSLNGERVMSVSRDFHSLPQSV